MLPFTDFVKRSSVSSQFSSAPVVDGDRSDEGQHGPDARREDDQKGERSGRRLPKQKAYGDQARVLGGKTSQSKNDKDAKKDFGHGRGWVRL